MRGTRASRRRSHEATTDVQLGLMTGWLRQGAGWTAGLACCFRSRLVEVPIGLAKTAGPIVQEALRLLVERRWQQTHTSGARCPGLPLGLVGSFQMRMYHTRHSRQFKVKQNTTAGSSNER